jgi:hypothetical protein
VESIGVCRTAEDGDECGTIKLELYSRRGFYLRMCASCLTPRFTLKVSNPVHPWEQLLWYVPLSGLGRIQQWGAVINKTGNENKRWNLGPFVQPLLSWKSNKLYISWDDIYNLSCLECDALAPYCHLWPARLCSIWPLILINDTVIETRYWAQNVYCDLLYNFLLKYISL